MTRAKVLRGLITASALAALAYGATFQGHLWGVAVIGAGAVLGFALLRRSSFWPSTQTQLGSPLGTEWPVGLLVGSMLATVVLVPAWWAQFHNDQTAEAVASHLCEAQLQSDHSITACDSSVGDFAGEPADWPSASEGACSVTFSATVKPALDAKDPVDTAELQFRPVVEEIREQLLEDFFFGGAVFSGKTLSGDSFSEVWFGGELANAGDLRC